MPNLAVIYMPDTHTHTHTTLPHLHRHTSRQHCIQKLPSFRPKGGGYYNHFATLFYTEIGIYEAGILCCQPRASSTGTLHPQPTPHDLCALLSVTLTRSSEASAQSGSPSQTQRLAMQAPLEQVCSATASHGTTGQLRSSLPSPQSSS